MEKEKFTELMIGLFNNNQLFIPSNININEWIKKEWSYYTN